jgi:predicted transposase YbfD/YdcC
MARKKTGNKTRNEEYAGGFPPGMEAFENLSDPRGGRAKRHYFGEVLFIALAAMVSGMDDFEDFERFAEEREDWLRQWLKLPNGTPSDDTFRRIFSALDPEAFGGCFIEFTAALGGRLGQELVAIDGKTLRGSFTAPDKSDALHLISAWASASGLTLGQLLVDSKTNEITAVPKLLRQIDVKGCVVSLDAMGCQKKIAIAIRHAEADYLLALKGNHGTLHGEVRDLFADSAVLEAARAAGKTVTVASSHDKGHGRVEERHLTATGHLDWMDAKERRSWLDLRSLVHLRSVREMADGRRSVEDRYWLTSLAPDAERLLEMSRSHWGIENQCHWVMDVTYGEDASRIRSGHAARNVSLLRRLAHNLLKHDQTVKDSIAGKRKRACLSTATLEKFLKLGNSK